MGDTDEGSYVAGVCNIGPAETGLRRRLGWLGLAAALLLAAGLLWLAVPRWWRVSVFLPAMLSASGFLQARHRFCVGFARRAVFNFDAVGHVEPVADESARASDRRTANQLTRLAAMIAVLAAAVAVAI